MRIEAYSVASVRHRNLDPDWHYAGRDVPELPGLRVALRAGREVGEGYAPFLPHLDATPEVLFRAGREIAAGMIGADAGDLDECLTRLGSCARPRNAGRSAVEMALLDLVARLRGQPVTRMLGGQARPIEVLRIIPVKSPERMAELADDYAAQGFRALKLKATGSVEADTARVAAVRDAVGPDVTITVDANQSYDAVTALELEKSLRHLGVWSLEQPVPATDLSALSRVRLGSAARIEADEGLFAMADLEALIAAEAADGISLKLARSGGILPSREMAHRAAHFGVYARLGTAFGGPLMTLATAALDAVVAAAGSAECAEFTHFDDDDHAPPVIRDGMLLPPDGPGFGQHRRTPWSASWEE
ncbi:mandelate racemase/muconate lactonizing enzyme family protein [Flavimaricola marinus]|uniref:L-Ala-D/L-Glu epimerase n=1 Tax=Flavimaricola marinus TaxID=1819565 RepID=A0A238LGM2_9RHOB|nr:enolase C-terminal domain-like protein [Flavimaricola marinus]SMY08839.1 L-Ala-D/L-Glu epimerase [Flavimaricola marinus]